MNILCLVITLIASAGAFRLAQKRNTVKMQYGQSSGGKRQNSRIQENDKGGRSWQSGKIFRDRPQRRRNDPWWMRDEEENNPRILPRYQPWWIGKVVDVDDSWKLPELKEEAKRRGLSAKGKKSELIAAINESSAILSMGDDGMVEGTFVDCKATNLSCYPVNYEGGVEAMDRMATAIMEQPF
jgi:hypothetical protein